MWFQRRTAVMVLTMALVATGCSADDAAAPSPSPTPTPTVTAPSPSPPSSPTPSPSPERTRSPSPAPRPAPTIPSLRLRRIATLSQPVAMATRVNDPGLYFAEKGGRVRRFRNGRTATVLDIRGSVSTGNEQGLLGLAFSPDGSRLYVNYTDTGGDTRLVEYGMTDDRRATSRRELLQVDQPFANHNGGMVAFGPDGMLYTSLGDGGSGGDPHGNAQSLDTLLGKILRIDPRPSGGNAYRIPRDNPFAGRSGRDEIWAYGLRNPWRFSFDAKRGDMWIGDVGQNQWEEIDFQPASSAGGENYGWDRLEGSHRFEGSPPRDHVLPVHEYENSGGTCAVTGGYVYRGERMPALHGWYFFADFCASRIMRLYRTTRGNVTVRDTGMQGSGITSFGEGRDGEIYALSLEGPVWRIEPA